VGGWLIQLRATDSYDLTPQIVLYAACQGYGTYQWWRDHPSAAPMALSVAHALMNAAAITFILLGVVTFVIGTVIAGMALLVRPWDGTTKRWAEESGSSVPLNTALPTSLMHEQIT
jgi:nicotinamide riboside transporter PnuC